MKDYVPKRSKFPRLRRFGSKASSVTLLLGCGASGHPRAAGQGGIRAQRGLFRNNYAMENAQEYWAEGVQDWYYTRQATKAFETRTATAARFSTASVPF
ncbi:MAG TPA: hypothetical protein VJV79_40855 [Polyangiaceae bacterium]|nr:hypothetical protein [Polyangiaceae bacterium]